MFNFTKAVIRKQMEDGRNTCNDVFFFDGDKQLTSWPGCAAETMKYFRNLMDSYLDAGLFDCKTEHIKVVEGSHLWIHTYSILGK